MGQNRQCRSLYEEVRIDDDMFGAVSMRAAYVSLKGLRLRFIRWAGSLSDWLRYTAQQVSQSNRALQGRGGFSLYGRPFGTRATRNANAGDAAGTRRAVQLRLTLAAAVRPLLGTQLFLGRQSSIAYFYEAGLNNSGRLR
jgi:hypothetical protein